MHLSTIGFLKSSIFSLYFLILTILLPHYISHAGDMYALSRTDLKASWDEGKLPLVEAPLSLAAAAKAEQTILAADSNDRIEVVCVYLEADIETLDIRLRNADVMEELQLQEELRRASEEVIKVQQDLSSSGAPVKGGVVSTVDRIVLASGSALETLMGVREMVGMLWHRPRAAIACQLVVDRFDWTSSRMMGRTELRMQTVLSGGATLELPRGKHLLRVNANHEQLHAVTFYSATDKMIANEYIEVSA